MMPTNRIGDHARLRGGYAFKSENFSESTGLPVIRISNLKDTGISIQENCVYHTPDGIPNQFFVRLGDTLIAMSGATTGKVARYQHNSPSMLNQRVGKFEVTNDAELDYGYLHHFVVSNIFRERLGPFLIAGAQPNISPSDIESIRIFLPPLPEQKKIAEILGACDEAIEAQERLIAQKQQRKKGLMQKLLTGEVRFPEFEGTAWREVAIGSLLKEVKRPVEWDDEEQYKLLSLRRRSGGPFARESLYGREIKTKTLKTVRTGDFLIAKMQVTHGALGLVTPEFDQYKVSASYICLVPRVDESFDIRFFNYLSQLRYIWHLAYVASYGVTIEKMTFVPKDFLKKKISVPSTKEECSAIADFIDSVNEEIAVQEKQLEQLKQQKKGLMQQLLTGKVRVKV